MKRFFIFAALLLTLALKADELPDKPPLILPGLEDVILRPTDMHDIDRSSARCICNYDPSSATLDFICNGTGRYTEIYLTDSYGNIMDVAAGDASQSTELSLSTNARRRPFGRLLFWGVDHGASLTHGRCFR